MINFEISYLFRFDWFFQNLFYHFSIILFFKAISLAQIIFLVTFIRNNRSIHTTFTKTTKQWQTIEKNGQNQKVNSVWSARAICRLQCTRKVFVKVCSNESIKRWLAARDTIAKQVSPGKIIINMTYTNAKGILNSKANSATTSALNCKSVLKKWCPGSLVVRLHSTTRRLVCTGIGSSFFLIETTRNKATNWSYDSATRSSDFRERLRTLTRLVPLPAGHRSGSLCVVWVLQLAWGHRIIWIFVRTKSLSQQIKETTHWKISKCFALVGVKKLPEMQHCNSVRNMEYSWANFNSCY